MLSTRSSFLRGLGSGVCCNCASSFGLTSASLTFAVFVVGFFCSGATTKRFAGVSLLNCNSVDPAGVGVLAEADGGTAVALRRLECGLVDFCAECGFGARNRCGEGVCVGILTATLEDNKALTAMAQMRGCCVS